MSKAHLFSTKVIIFLLVGMSIALFTYNHKAYAQTLQDILNRVQALEAENAALRARVVELETKTTYIRVETGDINGLSGPHTIFEGTNVHVQSGSGSTDDDITSLGGTLTGLGNLIVGYNEARPGQIERGDRTGSHNLIVGWGHNYSSYGGLVAGLMNDIAGPLASVSGGRDNEASGNVASVSGGAGRIAVGLNNWVAGALFQGF